MPDEAACSCSPPEMLAARIRGSVAKTRRRGRRAGGRIVVGLVGSDARTPSRKQQPTVRPDLRCGPSGGLTTFTDEHPLPEPRRDQWRRDPHPHSQQAQGVVPPPPLPGCRVEGFNELVRRAEEAGHRGEHPDRDRVGAGGPSGHGGAQANRALEISASSRKAARATANARGRPRASRPTITIP